MRLIDADALLDKVKDYGEGQERLMLIDPYWVRKAPTVEAEQRPHGEWIWKKDEDALRTYDLLCSECGCKIFTCENYDNVEQAKKVVDDRIREGKTLYPFCPCCGSDNRKRGEAE